MHPVRPAIILFALLVPMMTLLSAAQTSPLVYPQARRSDQVDDYHGTKVADPYRWMEAGTADPQFLAFLHAQND